MATLLEFLGHDRAGNEEGFFSARVELRTLDYRTPKAFGDLVRCKVPPSAGAAAAILKGDEQGLARDRAREGVESRIEVN